MWSLFEVGELWSFMVGESVGQNKHKELLEDQIISKWEGVNATGESK